jgi:hypothetical protein
VDGCAGAAVRSLMWTAAMRDFRFMVFFGLIIDKLSK